MDQTTTSRPQPKYRKDKGDGETQIIGIRMTPQLAQEVKLEATRRGMTLKSLFAEIWENYKRASRS